MKELTGWYGVTKNLPENMDQMNNNCIEAKESIENAIDTMNINIDNVLKLLMGSELQREKLGLVAREFSEWKVG
jgi:hypothetical protein